MEQELNTIMFPGTEPEGEEESLELEFLAEGTPQKVILLAVDTGGYDIESSMEELAALAEANGMEPVAEVVQKRERPDAATKLGAGRLAEAKLIAQNLGAEAAVFDGELSGSNLRNIEARLGIPVLDRTMLILQIFASRAVSSEGKTQTELAALQYYLPRLSGMGTVLSRQGGGGGGSAGARRGGGETQLEYDRRHIRARIAMLKKRLTAMEKRRDENRRSREKSGIPVIAMVGYTNVGKSSLVNALAGSDILAKDMLFATLDATARRTMLPDGQDVILVDTVGFVSRLPHGLVAAFKSTLQEAAYADVLVLVADAADPAQDEALAVTNEVLDGLDIPQSVPRLVVYNKCDKVPGFIPFNPEALCVSAATGQGLEALKAALAEKLSGRMRKIKVLLPYDKLGLADIMRRHGRVEKEDYREDGVYYEAVVEAAKAASFADYVYEGQ